MIVFVAVSVLPLVCMLAVTPSAAGALLLDARQWTLLSNTALLGVSTAALASAIGVPLGVALARSDLPGKRTLRVLLAAPMLLPPYVGALAWVSLGGGAWTYSLAGAVLVLALVFYPLSMLATEVAVRRIDPHLEEAARIVMNPASALWRVTLRLAAPGVAAAALVIFVLAIAEFGVPGLLRVRVFTTEVFTAFAALYDFGRATVIAMPLLLLSMIVAAIAVSILGERLITARGAGTTPEDALPRRWTSVALAGAVVVVLAALVVPLVLLLREAAALRSWSTVVDGSSAAIVNSLLFAAIGATMTALVGLVLGYARARARPRTAVVADLVLVVLFAVPSTILGVGLIALWNRPGPLGGLYGTGAMLLLACMARFLPLAALGMGAAVRHVPVSHEEAAAAAGAGWARTMTNIVLPQVSTALMAVWVVVFVLAFGELGTSILVAPPGESTLPIRIYTLIANAPPADVAALALLQAGVILAPVLLLAYMIPATKT